MSSRLNAPFDYWSVLMRLPCQDKRPLPEIIADGNPNPDTGWPVFPLAYKDIDGKRYYAIQDWIRGVAQPADARKFWDAMKRRLNKAGIELSTWCRQLPYRASNGKTYNIDHTQAEGLYRNRPTNGREYGIARPYPELPGRIRCEIGRVPDRGK